MESLKISIHYKQNKKKELLRTCRSIADQVRLETDCLRSQVEEDIDNKTTILLTQQWQSRAALNNYFSSDLFAALSGAMRLFSRNYEIQINGVSQEFIDRSNTE